MAPTPLVFTPHEPLWNDTTKEQCNKAKAFWDVWIKRHCSKCESFHLTSDDIAFLRRYESKFSTATDLFSKARKLLGGEIKKREENYKLLKRLMAQQEMRDVVLFIKEQEQYYRRDTGQRRMKIWKYKYKTEEMVAEKEDLFSLTFLIDELEVDMDNGTMDLHPKDHAENSAE